MSRPSPGWAPHTRSVTAPDRQTGLRVSAWAIRHDLVTAADATTARAYLGAVPGITDDIVDSLLTGCRVDPDTVVSRMPAPDRTRLADALDAAAAVRPKS